MMATWVGKRAAVSCGMVDFQFYRVFCIRLRQAADQHPGGSSSGWWARQFKKLSRMTAAETGIQPFLALGTESIVIGQDGGGGNRGAALIPKRTTDRFAAFARRWAKRRLLLARLPSVPSMFFCRPQTSPSAPAGLGKAVTGGGHLIHAFSSIWG